MGTLEAMFVICAVAAADVMPTPASAPDSIVLRIRGEQAHPALAPFLATKLEQRWQCPVLTDQRASVSADPGSFVVDVLAMSGAQLSVSVFMGDRLLGERTLEVTDPMEAQLGLWLFVRSSIERGIRSAAPSAAHGLITASAGTAAPAPPMPRSPRIQTSSTEAVEPPVRGGFVAVLATAWLETPDLFAVGASAEVGLHRDWLSVAAGLGYRVARGPRSLDLHGLPVMLSLAITSHHRHFSASLGALVRADVELAWTPNKNAWAFGAEAGPFGRARMPLADDFGMVLQFGLAWRLRRQRYLLDGQEAVEQPWASNLSLGVDWQ